MSMISGPGLQTFLVALPRVRYIGAENYMIKTHRTLELQSSEKACEKVDSFRATLLVEDEHPLSIPNEIAFR
jgi:hypothetical protein